MDISSFKGTLFGAAIGDALGAPMEGHTPDKIRELYGFPMNYVKAEPDRRTAGLNPGDFTDDTEMIIALSESIVDCNGFNVEDFAKKYIEWYNSPGFSRSRGKTCELAGLSLSHGRHWTESGRDGEAGNGTAMRAPPLGLLYDFSTLDQLTTAAFESSIISHRDVRAVAGAACVGAAIIYAREHNELDQDEFLDFLVRYTTDVERYASERLGQEIEDSLSRYLQKIPKLIPRGRNIVNSGYVVLTIPAALTFFLRSPDNYLQSVCEAANNGGDADTVACITGAISGAYNGIGGIPERLINKLEGRSHINYLSNKIYNIVKDGLVRSTGQ